MSVEVTVGQASLKSLELQLPTSGLVKPLMFIRICKASVALGSWVFRGVCVALFIKWELLWHLSTTGKAECCCRPTNSIQPSWALKGAAMPGLFYSMHALAWKQAALIWTYLLSVLWFWTFGDCQKNKKPSAQFLSAGQVLLQNKTKQKEVAISWTMSCAYEWKWWLYVK